MYTNNLLRNKAIKLRLSGNTYSEINTNLPKKIPKSTLSLWFKNLKFTKYQDKKLKNHVLNKIKKAQKMAIKVTKQAFFSRSFFGTLFSSLALSFS